MSMPKQEVTCGKCGTTRTIIRKKLTPKDYSFWCSECRKEVPQAMPNQPIEETTKWSPHQGICSVKECLWNGRRHPEESNQPIEEKWKEALSKKCPWLYKGAKFKIVVSFIENLLEQERKRMSDEIEKKATFHEVAVSNVEVKTTRMVRLDDVKAIIKTR